MSVTYFLTYVFLCVLAIISPRVSRVRRAGLYFFGCAVLIFLICFRDISVGADTENYCRNFEWFAGSSWKQAFQIVTWEPGFVIVSKLIGYLSSDWRVFVIITGLIALLPLFKFLWKHSGNPCAGLVIYFVMLFTMSEYLYRQWYAFLILLGTYRYIIERKPGRFLLVVMAATLFHRTALIFLPVYFLYPVKPKKLLLIVCICISAILYLFGGAIISLALKFARTSYELQYNGGESMLVFLWLCVLTLCFLDRKIIAKPWYRLQFWLLLISATLQPISMRLSLWSRIVIYFSPALMFLVPRFFEDTLLSKKKYGLSMLCEIGFFGLFSVLFYVRLAGRTFVLMPF